MKYLFPFLLFHWIKCIFFQSRFLVRGNGSLIVKSWRNSKHGELIFSFLFWSQCWGFLAGYAVLTVLAFSLLRWDTLVLSVAHIEFCCCRLLVLQLVMPENGWKHLITRNNWYKIKWQHKALIISLSEWNMFKIVLLFVRHW